MDKNKEIDNLIKLNSSLILTIYNKLIELNEEIPKELEDEVKKLTLTDVVVPKGTLCECKQLSLNYVTDKLHCVKCGKEDDR